MSKKILSIFIALMMVVTVLPNAFAIDYDDISNTTSCNGEFISTYTTSKPSKEWNWKNGSYYFSGHSFSQPLYSNYYFTKASKVRITVYNNSETKLTVKLLKQQVGVDWSVSTKKIEGGKSLTWEVNIDSSRVYILEFLGTHTDFDGWILQVSA